MKLLALVFLAPAERPNNLFHFDPQITVLFCGIFIVPSGRFCGQVNRTTGLQGVIMKLDSGETLELETSPNQKILFMWFLNKTLSYSIVTMFFVFMCLFFINTLNNITNHEKSEDLEIIESSPNPSETNKEQGENRNINHPFQIIINYWGWALVLVVVIAIVIQIYLHFLRQTYRYIVTDERCIFVGGILKRVERTVPHKKITDIQRTQNIIERILGIWNVQVFTPGTASVQIGQSKARAELNFDGLIDSEEIYEAISRHTQING